MKKIAPTLIAIAALSVISTSANAEWTLIDKDSTVSVYADKSTILRDGDRVIMSTLDDLELPNKFRGGFYASTRWLEHYDCAKKKHRVISSTFYEKRMGKGAVVEEFGPTQSWDEIHPDTASEKMWKIACEKNESNPLK